MTCALPLYMYQLKFMIHDHDLEVTHAVRDGTALNFTQTSADMQRINLLQDRRAKREGMYSKIRNSGFIMKICPRNKQIIFEL